jgi:MoxR-like ATPase
VQERGKIMKLLIANKEMDVVTIKQHQMDEVLDAGKELDQNVMVYGPSGVGKSQKIKQWSIGRGYDFLKISLALEVPETIAGIPYKDTSKSDRIAYFTKLLSKQLEPLFINNGKFKVLFLDEINQAQPEVLNCLYGVCDMEDRNWAGYPLENVMVVAAGNLSDGTDGTVYLNDLPTPLHNRYFIYELIPDDKDTMKYLKEKYKNIKQVGKYIQAMLDEKIPPRDIEQCLKVIAYAKSTLPLQAKLGSGLTQKLLDIQKKLEITDPVETLKRCREVYKLYQENGKMNFGDVVVTEDEELIDKFKELGLSEEEIASIMKGE